MTRHERAEMIKYGKEECDCKWCKIAQHLYAQEEELMREEHRAMLERDVALASTLHAQRWRCVELVAESKTRCESGMEVPNANPSL